MSGRLLKKFLKEQEQAALQKQQQQQQLTDEEEDDSESPPRSSVPFRNPFDLLEDDGDVEHLSDKDDDDDGAVRNIDRVSPGTQSSVVKPSVTAAPSAKSKKKKKKKKSKGDLVPSSDNEGNTSSLAFENLSLGASSSSSQPTAGLPPQPKLIEVDNHVAMLKKQRKSSVLLVDPKFLSAQSELKRIFGAKVVNSFERSRAPANSRQMRGVRRGGYSLKKTILISPPEEWPRWDGSLSMELLETRDGVNFFRYVHSSSYAHVQRAFEAAKAIHDFNGILSILLHHPYHIESLITLADYFKFTGEHQMSTNAMGKCLYALECAWHPQFTPSQNCQVKYVHDTNKPLFSSLFTHMKNMDQRGCHRSALEISKLLISLDPDDPMGAKLCVDYYALRAEEYSWLEQFAEEYGSDNSLWLFPNFSYSLAISRFYLERNENLEGEKGVGKAASSDLMKQALMLHPSVLRKLVDKVPLKERIWSSLLQHSFFKSDQTGSASLDHLISIYVERSYLMWRLPELQKFLSSSALSVIDMLEKSASEAEDWACVRKEAFSSEKNEYSHLLVSNFSDSVPTMPPENLHDFIVPDPRAGIENQGGFDHIPQEHHEPRDVANRNPLAVLFESILPWVNYGTRDGEDNQDDNPEHAGED